MFTAEEANEMAAVLERFGYMAWPHEAGDLGWSVWCETVGLSMFEMSDIKGFLMLQWSAEQRAQEMPNG